jgi:hypothetical protein
MAEIKFPKTKWDALGRNGFTACCGIVISDFGEEILFEPLNSRGVVGKARLVVPRYSLPELRDRIDRLINSTD